MCLRPLTQWSGRQADATLERGEERLRERVVPAVARPPDRQGDLAVLGEGSVGSRRVLAAPIGVEDYARTRVTDGDRVGQRVRDQFRAQVVREGVADDAAGGDVDDGDEIKPAFPSRDVSDVAVPAGVDPGGVGGEVPPDPVPAPASTTGRPASLRPASHRGQNCPARGCGQTSGVKVVVTEIGWEGKMRRRALDTSGLTDADRWENLIEQALASPPPYRAAPGQPVYMIYAGDRAVLVAKQDLTSPLAELVETILETGGPPLATERAGSCRSDRDEPSTASRLQCMQRPENAGQPVDTRQG